MLPTVLAYLRPRLDPHRVRVDRVVVPADALALLDRMWSVTWDHGWPVGDVRPRALLLHGHHDVAMRWLEATGRGDSWLHRHLSGRGLTLTRRAKATFEERIDMLRADLGAGRPLPDAELAALDDLASTRREERALKRLRRDVRGEREPVYPASPLDPRGPVDLHDFVMSGDLEGCREWFELEVAEAEGDWATVDTWVELAKMCRFLTDDDARAAGFLERLGFQAVGDGWIDVFGDRGRARIQAEKDAILALIDRAFDGIPFPGPEHRSLYQAEAADDYDHCDQSRDHKGRWQDLPRDQILACQWALPHIRAGSLPYYLPALMSFCVREHDLHADDHASGWIFESVRFHFQRSSDPRLQEYMRERHAGLTREQFAAIHRFTAYYGNEPEDVERWRRLAEGGAWDAG